MDPKISFQFQSYAQQNEPSSSSMQQRMGDVETDDDGEVNKEKEVDIEGELKINDKDVLTIEIHKEVLDILEKQDEKIEKILKLVDNLCTTFLSTIKRMNNTVNQITEDAKMNVNEIIIQQTLSNLTALLKDAYEKQGNRVIEIIKDLDKIAHLTYTGPQKEIIKQIKDKTISQEEED
ncbi:uncharacterized protein LOC127278679 [Leptopilina boulardi]|uniref:uncharacterized protein LOC127278679 n=1 Tax=Leptopilina boulardi TaxID=63433 RepID=UPI0021F626E8|nr:uncharacterized protein LOC127278679 [Leptopilina boulardi]